MNIEHFPLYFGVRVVSYMPSSDYCRYYRLHKKEVHMGPTIIISNTILY